MNKRMYIFVMVQNKAIHREQNDIYLNSSAATAVNA